MYIPQQFVFIDTCVTIDHHFAVSLFLTGFDMFEKEVEIEGERIKIYLWYRNAFVLSVVLKHVSV